MAYVDPKVKIKFKDKTSHTSKSTDFVVGTHLFAVNHSAVTYVKVECRDSGDGRPEVKVTLEP